MRIIILIVLVISGLTAVACSSEPPSTPTEQTESRPTADVPATVEAGIRGTREAETAIDATVEAKVAAALPTSTSTPAPMPTATPPPTNTPLLTSTPGPTTTPRPTATPFPTATPYPTTAPAPTAVAAPQPTPTTAPTVTPRPTSTPLPTLTVSLIDDHGNDFESATRIAIGEAVAVELENNDDIDVLFFRARPGTEFLLTLNWEYYEFRENYTESPLLAVYSANGQEQTRLTGYDLFETGGPSIGLVWRAVTGGDYYIVIGDGNTVGASAFSISEGEATEPIIVDDHASNIDSATVTSDRAALVAFYNVMGGGSWRIRTNWLSGRPLDEWYGVTTGSDGRVTGLNLSSNSVYGALPAELGDLTKLRELRLADNPLRGPIPAELGDLSNLRVLNLGSQGRGSLNGPIPAALGNLTNLESLDLSSNELTGPIPAWLGDLTNLRALNLWSNELTGPIPAWLGDLANLEYLSLGWNELTGPIPAKLGDLTNLEWLFAYQQRVNGDDPGRAGRPHQPERAAPIVQQPDGADPGRAEQPL